MTSATTTSTKPCSRSTIEADQDLSFIVGLNYQTSTLDLFDTLALTDTSIIIPVVNTLTQSTNGQYLGNTATPR